MQPVGRVVLFAILSLFTAESTTSLEQFLQTITNEIETETGDTALAHQVERTKLAEQLSDDEIRWLSTVGAGPNTVKTLRKLQERSASLPAPTPPVITFEPRPTMDEVHGILRQVTGYVNRYTTTLVDFTCTMTTKTYTKEKDESRPLSDTSIVITAPSNWQQKKNSCSRDQLLSRARVHL